MRSSVCLRRGRCSRVWRGRSRARRRGCRRSEPSRRTALEGALRLTPLAASAQTGGGSLRSPLPRFSSGRPSFGSPRKRLHDRYDRGASVGTAGFACGRRFSDPEKCLGTLGPNHPLESATASSAIRPCKQKAPAAGNPAAGTFSRDGRIRTGDPLNPVQVRYRTAPRPGIPRQMGDGKVGRILSVTQGLKGKTARKTGGQEG